jgi:regulation of enolase protein 1 (concanavalin A-like superfamily)
MPIRSRFPPAPALAWLLLFVGGPLQAQLGPGWIQYSPTKKIHLDDEAGLQIFNWTSSKSVCSNTTCADYSYDSATDTEIFRIFDSRSNRSEIRLQNEYSTGRRQFEGYVTFYPPLEDESLMQIFGSTTGATLTMTRGYASSGGHITCTGTGGGVTFGTTTIATACYGVELRINVIHDQDNYIRWYVNGVLKCEQLDTEVGVDNYHKYGCYGTTSGNVPAVVKWRAVRSFKDGFAPNATVTAAPGVITVPQGGSATSRIDVAGFSGNVTLSLSNLPAGATATLNPPTMTGGGGSSMLTLTTIPGIATGSYPLALRAAAGVTNSATTVTVGVIPAGWTDMDIGGPAQSGGASYSNGIFTVNGGGNDIWSSADKFNFLWRTFPGDLTASARVDAQENTNPWAKAGLMVRESTNAGSKYVGIYVTPSNGVSIQYRSTNDAPAVDLARNSGIIAPHWVRLARVGNAFTGYRSADGTSWTQVGAVNISMANAVLVGLPVTAHDDSTLNTADLSHVSMPPMPRPRITAFTLNGSNEVISGTNGLPGWPYYLLASTNLGLAITNWTRVFTNQFSANGAFAITNALSPSTPQQFYLLQLQ